MRLRSHGWRRSRDAALSGVRRMRTSRHRSPRGSVSRGDPGARRPERLTASGRLWPACATGARNRPLGPSGARRPGLGWRGHGDGVHPPEGAALLGHQGAIAQGGGETPTGEQGADLPFDLAVRAEIERWSRCRGWLLMQGMRRHRPTPLPCCSRRLRFPVAPGAPPSTYSHPESAASVPARWPGSSAAGSPPGAGRCAFPAGAAR